MDFSPGCVEASGPGGLPGRIESNGDQECLQIDFDHHTDSACLAIVSLVSAATNSSPVELTPLQSVIDVDALNRLLASESNGSHHSVSTSFHYEGLEVTVDSEGRIEVVPRNRTG